MCVIVDTNLASLVFCSPPRNDFVPVISWLENDGCLVYGGELYHELQKISNASRYLLELNRAGNAKTVPEREMKREEKMIADKCVSDDPHVVALARLSGARTLVSRDGNLGRDFKNKLLIDYPRGKVYKNRSHRHLLKHTPESCKRGR